MPSNRRTVYTLAVEGYPAAITALTFPLLRRWAEKIGAKFVVIRKRRFPDWPVVCEKFQVGTLAALRDDTWSIFLDADVLVHPDAPDFVSLLRQDTVYHVKLDLAAARFHVQDPYFRRSATFRSPGDWCAIASSWCRDVWAFPPEEWALTPDAVRARIRPLHAELAAGVTADGLFDDYLVARNEARFGLKTDTLIEFMGRMGIAPLDFLWHDYLHTNAEKPALMREVLDAWKL